MLTELAQLLAYVDSLIDIKDKVNVALVAKLEYTRDVIDHILRNDLYALPT